MYSEKATKNDKISKLFLTRLSNADEYWHSQNICRLTNFLKTNPSQNDARNKFYDFLAFFVLKIISNFL